MNVKAKVKSRKSGVAGNGTPDRLLDAAEAVFARNGYDAASIRTITKVARVPLALAHYHFKSKEELFRRVLIRRVDALRSKRLELLQKFKDRALGRPIPIDEVVEAFAEPAFHLSMNGGQGWKNYMKLNAQISIAEKYVSMVGDVYDPTATIFMGEMHRALPNASAPSIKWGYLFAVAVTAAALAESGRIEILSNNKIKSSQLVQAYNHAKIFISDGLQGLNSRPAN
jgi:AcrR family transcriptional regulator